MCVMDLLKEKKSILDCWIKFSVEFCRIKYFRNILGHSAHRFEAFSRTMRYNGSVRNPFLWKHAKHFVQINRKLSNSSVYVT